MTSRGDEEEYRLHCMAVIAARQAAGLVGIPLRDPDDPWWEEGPHLEKDGRSYYVHAMGCLQSNLGHAMEEHPDWYLVAALVRGRDVEVHGLDDDSHAMTLAEVRASEESLSPDERRLAWELTPREKRRGWGVTSDDRA